MEAARRRQMIFMPLEQPSTNCLTVGRLSTPAMWSISNVTPTPPSQRLAEFGFMGRFHLTSRIAHGLLSQRLSGRPQSMGLIRQWIETEGKAQDIIPKPTTKTTKHSVPVAAAPLPQGVGGKAGNNESNYLWVYIAWGDTSSSLFHCG